MDHTILEWIIFHSIIGIILFFDLVVSERYASSFKRNLVWTVGVVCLALMFNRYIYISQGSEAALSFLSGYIIEKSLSIDNLFVFLLIFQHFNLSEKQQHTVLRWGIIGAILLRGLMIWLGVAALKEFHGILYFLGALLIYSAYRFIKTSSSQEHSVEALPGWLNKLLEVSSQKSNAPLGSKEDQQKKQKRQLFIVIVLVELTDLMFALDSIPAIFAITLDPYIIYTSNIFALLGLRALFFVISDTMNRFIYLKQALAVILGFVGLKLLLSDIYPIPLEISLGVIFGVITAGILISLNHSRARG